MRTVFTYLTDRQTDGRTDDRELRSCCSWTWRSLQTLINPFALNERRPNRIFVDIRLAAGGQ